MKMTYLLVGQITIFVRILRLQPVMMVCADAILSSLGKLERDRRANCSRFRFQRLLLRRCRRRPSFTRRAANSFRLYDFAVNVTHLKLYFILDFFARVSETLSHE